MSLLVSLCYKASRGCRPHQASYSIGTAFFFSGVKRPGRDVDHLSLCNVEVKNEWSLTFASPVCLPGMERDNFTFCVIQFLDVVQT